MTVRVIIFDLAATGVSGDTKPTFVDGGLFFEEDTGKVFVTQGGVWVENLNAAYMAASSYAASMLLMGG